MLISLVVAFVSIAQWRGDWTHVCSEGLTASQNAQIAHMDRVIIVPVWGMREEQNSSARAKKSRIKPPREPIGWTLCVKWVKNSFRSFSILVRGRGVDV